MYNVCLGVCVCVKIVNVFCIALHTENKHYYPVAIMRRLMCVRQQAKRAEGEGGWRRDGNKNGGKTSNSKTLAPNGGRHLNR